MLQSGGAARILAMRHPLTASDNEGGRTAHDAGGSLSVHLDELADAAGAVLASDVANIDIQGVSFAHTFDDAGGTCQTVSVESHSWGSVKGMYR